MGEPRELRAYMIYDRIGGASEGATLVFARTAREARRVGFDTMHGLYECEWIDVTTRLLKSGAPSHRDPAKEAKGEPYEIDCPQGCLGCEYWFEKYDADGYCEACAESRAEEAELEARAASAGEET